MGSNDLSGQPLPRRPTDDYADEPASLGPLPNGEHATSPARPSRVAGGDASQLQAGDASPPTSTIIVNECRCGITRADLWIAVAASSAIAVIVAELLRGLGL